MLSMGINVSSSVKQAEMKKPPTSWAKTVRESLVSNYFKYVNVTRENPFK